MRIFVIGRPGAGKTTLAKALAGRLGWPHISGGDIAREAAEMRPDIQAILDRGDLFPKRLMDDLMMNEIADHTSAVIDGYPRYLTQLLDVFQIDPGPFNPHFIHLDIPPRICAQRMVERGRRGDKIEAINRRFEIYRAETQPVAEWLTRRYARWTFRMGIAIPVEEMLFKLLEWRTFPNYG